MFVDEDNKSRQALPGLCRFLYRCTVSPATPPELIFPHRNLRPAAAFVRSPKRWAILSTRRFGAKGGALPVSVLAVAFRNKQPDASSLSIPDDRGLRLQPRLI